MYMLLWCHFLMYILVGAKRAREVVFSVLRDACDEGDLSVPEALEAVTDIFSGNAKMFYKIDSAVPFRHFSDTISKLDNHMKGTQQDLVLVRVLWVDASGQHRCRVSSFNFPFRTFNVSLSSGSLFFCYPIVGNKREGG